MKKYIVLLLILLSSFQFSIAQEVFAPIKHIIHQGYEYSQIATGDIDSDGMDEIVTIASYKGVSHFEIFDIGSDGSLEFQQAIFDIEPYFGPLFLDMDNDGDLDLVNRKIQELTWLENTGNGVFATTETSFFDFGGFPVSSVLKFDYDNDGDSDLLVSKHSESHLLENNNGVFTNVQTIDAIGDYYGFSTADLDYDNDLDLIYRTDGDVYFYYNDNGFFNVSPLISSIDNTSSYKIAAGDMDNDGDIDVVYTKSNGQEVIVALNAGDNLDFSNTTVINNPNSNGRGEKIKLLDIDSDGDLDVFWGVNEVPGSTWFRNTDDGFIPQEPVTEGIDHPICQHYVPIQFNSDSEIEIAAISSRLDRLYTFKYDSILDTLVSSGDYEAITNRVIGLQFSDMDGDGDKEIISTTRESENIVIFDYELPNENNALFVVDEHHHQVSSIVYTADFNGDGFEDIISPSYGVSSYTYLYLSQGAANSFAAPIMIAESLMARNVIFDVDNDGDLDLFAFFSFDKDYFFLENIDGNGTFAAPVSIHHNFSVGSYPGFSADLDNDGDLDLILHDYQIIDGEQHRRLVFLENDGNGNLAAAVPFYLFPGEIPYPYQLHHQDMNGDGVLDIVYNLTHILNGEAMRDIHILYGTNDPFVFSPPNVILQQFQNEIPFFNNNILIEDIDLDGDLDIFDQGHSWLRNQDNSGTFEVLTYQSTTEYKQLFGLEDMDDDGDKDFVFADQYQIYWRENAVIHKYWIEGAIVADTSENCEADPNEFNFGNWTVTAANDEYSLATIADSSGHYMMPVGPGDWALNALSKSDFWTPCFEDSLVTISMDGDTISTDFLMQPNGDCAFIEWSTSTDRLRPCQSNTFSLDLCNYGVMVAEDVILEVSFDSLLYFISASHPYTVDADSTFFFDIGTLDINECTTITIDAFLDCDSITLFQLQCVEFRVHPSEICVPENSTWDGSTVQVDGLCQGDSIYFSIQNIGTNNMVTPSQFRVEIINDDIVMLFVADSFQLDIAEQIELTYPRQGLGMRLSADQTEDNPFNNEASVIVPNCEDIANNIVLNWLQNDDGNPFVDLFCNPIFGSYDPNDKAAIPAGVGEEHTIEKDWELDYTIRFQNTGNDTAFLVVLRDTISEHLDLSTLEVHGGSHNNRYELNPARELKIIFENILLPDSTTNLEGSQGFASYSIKPIADIPSSTKIKNTAYIYFDFNAPIVTNTTLHTIRRPVVATNEHITVCGDNVFVTDTILRTSFAFAEYDSIHFVHVEVSPYSVAEITIDTAVTVGTLIAGVLIENDTSFTEILMTQQGCDSLTHFEVDIINGVNNTHFEHIKIFPNPVTDYLTILNNVTTEPQQWQLTNVTGQQVWTKNKGLDESLNPIDLRELPAGIYLLEVKTKNKYGIWKVVKY